MRSRLPAPSAAALASLVMLLAVIGIGCRGCWAGPVNASPALRWWLFSNFGASKICPEMLKRGVGLKLQERGDSIGRFFPTGCTIDVNGDNQTVTVHFSGHGYAFTSVTRRMGFTTSASVEFRPDFFIGEEDLYVWGKVNRIVRGPDFKVGFIENGVVDVATALTPLGGLANMFGNQIVAGEVTRGFTVVENNDTETRTFALGLINPPAKPQTPYNLDDDELYTFANESVEVQYNQRDFLGPFEVVESGQQLLARMYLEGPQVEVLLVDKLVGDQWRDSYIQGRVLGPPPGPVLGGAALTPGRELRQGFRVPPGQYYLVIDHTQYAGVVNPPPANILNPVSGGPRARIQYALQLADL